ncbi:MAG: hypothetical protein GY931_17585 [Maribacter sp.]|nr:hypothetical protein [Maribacter sp.]
MKKLKFSVKNVLIASAILIVSVLLIPGGEFGPCGPANNLAGLKFFTIILAIPIYVFGLLVFGIVLFIRKINARKNPNQ